MWRKTAVARLSVFGSAKQSNHKRVPFSSLRLIPLKFNWVAPKAIPDEANHPNFPHVQSLSVVVTFDLPMLTFDLPPPYFCRNPHIEVDQRSPPSTKSGDLWSTWCFFPAEIRVLGAPESGDFSTWLSSPKPWNNNMLHIHFDGLNLWSTFVFLLFFCLYLLLFLLVSLNFLIIISFSLFLLLFLWLCSERWKRKKERKEEKGRRERKKEKMENKERKSERKKEGKKGKYLFIGAVGLLWPKPCQAKRANKLYNKLCFNLSLGVLGQATTKQQQ